MTAGVLPSISTSPVRSASASGRPCQSTAASVPGRSRRPRRARSALPRATSNRPPATRERKPSSPSRSSTVTSSPAAAAGSNSVLSAITKESAPNAASPVGKRRLAAPAAELEDDRLEREAALGQLVDARARRRRELAPAHEPGLLELAQALGEHVGAEARQAGAQVGEALRAEQQLADDQQRPALADDVEGARDAAAVAVGPFGRHRRQSTDFSPKFHSSSWNLQLHDTVAQTQTTKGAAMSERDGYEPGVPCWVDTRQPDPRAAVGLLHAAVRLGGRDQRRLHLLPAPRPRRRRDRRRATRPPGAPTSGSTAPTRPPRA